MSAVFLGATRRLVGVLDRRDDGPRPRGRDDAGASSASRASTPRRCATWRTSPRSTRAGYAWWRSRGRGRWCPRARAEPRPGWWCTPTPSGCAQPQDGAGAAGVVRRHVSPAPTCARWSGEYGADPEPLRPVGPPAAAGERGNGHARRAPREPEGAAAGDRRPAGEVDNDLYVRDYARCILCYKCVEACGRTRRTPSLSPSPAAGSTRRISTEFAVPLPESACVYCGNCIGVCPTGALMFASEHELRAGGRMGRLEADGHHHHLPVLRGRLQPRPARAGEQDRQGDLAARPRRHPRAPVHQGAVRLRVRPAPRRGVLTPTWKISPR